MYLFLLIWQGSKVTYFGRMFKIVKIAAEKQRSKEYDKCNIPYNCRYLSNTQIHFLVKSRLVRSAKIIQCTILGY